MERLVNHIIRWHQEGGNGVKKYLNHQHKGLNESKKQTLDSWRPWSPWAAYNDRPAFVVQHWNKRVLILGCLDENRQPKDHSPHGRPLMVCSKGTEDKGFHWFLDAFTTVGGSVRRSGCHDWLEGRLFVLGRWPRSAWIYSGIVSCIVLSGNRPSNISWTVKYSYFKSFRFLISLQVSYLVKLRKLSRLLVEESSDDHTLSDCGWLPYSHALQGT